jgi:ABC-2 type transport system ATP-binding protein
VGLGDRILESTKKVVHLKNLRKNYGQVHALQGLDLDIFEKEIFGLLGPNGAGKTTLVKILLGLINRTSGDVEVFGMDPKENPLAIRSMSGYVMQERALDSYLSGRENLELQAALYNLPSSSVKTRVKEALSWSGLSQASEQIVLRYSGGMKRRLEVAMGTINRPRLLLLDEPTLGLDVSSRRQLWDIIRKMREGGVAILLTTHYLEEASELCDRVCIINNGRVVGLGTPEQLKKETVSDQHRLIVRFKEPPTLGEVEVPLPAELHGLEGVFKGSPQQLLETMGILQQRLGTLIDEIVFSQPTLDDVFMKLTQVKTPVTSEG